MNIFLSEARFMLPKLFIFQILNLNPQLRAMVDLNPQLREMMQNPELLRQLTNPETMQVFPFRSLQKHTLTQHTIYAGLYCLVLVFVYISWLDVT